MGSRAGQAAGQGRQLGRAGHGGQQGRAGGRAGWAAGRGVATGQLGRGRAAGRGRGSRVVNSAGRGNQAAGQAAAACLVPYIAGNVRMVQIFVYFACSL